MTQETLALRIRISASEVSRLEKGRRNPKWETMKRIAMGLGVSCAELVALGEKFDRERDEET